LPLPGHRLGTVGDLAAGDVDGRFQVEDGAQVAVDLGAALEADAVAGQAAVEHAGAGPGWLAGKKAAIPGLNLMNIPRVG
jgi:hypothetical protein